MKRFSRAFVVGVGATVALGLAVGAIAQTDPPSTGDDALDAIRDAIPEGFPGKFDLTEASAEFGMLVSLFGQSSQVADFGTGSQLTGPCGGYAFSYDKDRQLIDAAIDAGDNNPPGDLLDGGQAFTSSNPFKVDTSGIVTYFGFSPEVGDGPLNHRWFIKTSGISVDKGGDPNTIRNNRNVGLVDLDNDLPVKFSAKVKIEGEMTSESLAKCVGKGHVEFLGNGLTDPVGLLGLALLGGGFFGLLFNSRPAMTYKG